MRLRSSYLRAIFVGCLLAALPVLSGWADMASLSGTPLDAARVQPPSSRRILTSGSSLPRQSPVASVNPQSIAGASKVALSIDGQVTPERVPDEVAYRHFISVTAVGLGASAADFHRRDAILEQVGLSGADRRAYVAATITVKGALQRIERNMETLHLDIAAVDALKQERGSLLDNAALRALSSLSADGVARMRLHINERVKRHIRIYSQVQQLPGRDQ